MKNIVIQNQNLQVEISRVGAELHSVKYLNEQRLWTGDVSVWGGRAPVLFPVCGTLKDDRYIYNGKSYTLKHHGFARKSLFEITSLSATKAVFKMSSSEETKVVYPFDFDFFISYELIENSIKVGYKLINRSLSDMWFSIGSHESFLLEGKLSDYSLIFEKKENFISKAVNKKGLIINEFDDFGQSTNYLSINEQLFKRDTAVFANLNSRNVSLYYKNVKKVDFAFDAPNLLIWTVLGANYICIEPWLNLPDYFDSDGIIENKPGILFLKNGKSYENYHTVTYYA
ncbi:MAG: aldose 1-epimerase family protein [Clostridia bacterium]|nr:aldose 1-epimerase family protein [Clostridia bacterium]